MKKKMTIYTGLLLLFFIVLLHYTSDAQRDISPPVPVVKLHYFNNYNAVQYLILESMLKKNKVLSPQKNKTYQLYLDSGIAERLIADISTDATGKDKAFIPPTLQKIWNAASTHAFIVKDAGEEIISDYTITRARINLDTSTSEGIRSITASVMKWQNNEWIPAPDVEMKVGIERNGSILSAGDEANYTSDSAGLVKVALTKDSLPGDSQGNYILAAKVDDNEQFGNLLVEKVVPWGTIKKTDTDFFNQRSLWTTRFRTPYWLLIMAYSIFIGVWGTIIYLLLQLVKIKKLAAIG